MGGGGSLNLEILRGGGSSSFGNSGGRGGGVKKPINMLLIIVRTYIFSFYSLVMAASSDHPETMKATRSLDNSEVQSFS